MEYNLFSPFGSNPLKYPHYTKWDDKKNIVHLVTQPDSIIKNGDTVFVAIESRNNEGEPVLTYFNKPAIVSDVIEQRKAKGEHKIPFNAIYQEVKLL